jgi:hypothetical protein
MENPKHWWLRTSDIRPVFTDQKRNYKVKWEPGYILVEFTEDQNLEVDMEKLAKEIAALRRHQHVIAEKPIAASIPDEETLRREI